jgi:HAD superfamily hydrolase (TIGR01509 family)
LSLPRLVRAVIFDMDGLLVDSESAMRAAMGEAAAMRALEMTDPLFLSLVGLPLEVNRRQLQDHYGDAFDVEAFLDDTYAAFRRRTLALKPGVVALLDRLDALDLPRAIATSSAHDAVEHALGPHGLTGRFHAVIARGDYPRGKPSPDPYLLAADRLGVDPTFCLALEDSHNGVRAAAAAGMMTVMAPDLLEATDEMRGLCCAVVDDLEAVLELLEPQAA